jgi:hypothetical protein
MANLYHRTDNHADNILAHIHNIDDPKIIEDIIAEAQRIHQYKLQECEMATASAERLARFRNAGK